MNYYYITGTSRGIGKAMAELLIRDDSNFVIGISRKETIKHRNYVHVKLDLSDVNEVQHFKFDKHENAKRICLINNSGDIGMVKPVGKLTNEEIIRNYNLNLVSPCILMNSFMNAYQLFNAEKVIINMSSGAGKNPVDGWSMYCASKAGLDMFSKVVDLEEKVRSHKNFRVLAIAPGVVDTEMQVHIRSAKQEDFSRLKDFISFKNDNILLQPDAVAQKFIHIINNLNVITEVVIAAKDH